MAARASHFYVVRHEFDHPSQVEKFPEPDLSQPNRVVFAAVQQPSVAFAQAAAYLAADPGAGDLSRESGGIRKVR